MKLNLQSLEFVLHENCAFGPKNVFRKTSVKPQSSPVQVAFLSKVPPVTVPRMKPTRKPWTPARIVLPWSPVVSHAPGLWPASVTKRPRSKRVSVYEPSRFFFTKNVRLTVSVAHAAPHEPLSVVVTVNVRLSDVAVLMTPLVAVVAARAAVRERRRAQRKHAEHEGEHGDQFSHSRVPLWWLQEVSPVGPAAHAETPSHTNPKQ